MSYYDEMQPSDDAAALRAELAWLRQALKRKAASLENAERSVQIQHVEPIGRWMRRLADGINEDAQ